MKNNPMSPKFERQYFQVVLESLPHPFYIIDAKSYQIIFANKAAKELAREDITTCHALTHNRPTPCDEKGHPCPLKEVLKTKKATVVEHIHYDKNGKMIFVEVHGYPIFNEENEVIQMIEYSIDISKRKKAENSLRNINEIYEKFVPKDFLNHLEIGQITDIKLGQQVQKEMTILFSDIRSFTTISENMSSDESFRFVNSYMNVMGPVIRKNKGFIDKYIGDAIMALFGNTADDALNAGLDMLNKLKEYNFRRNKAGYKPINIGIGINTGLLMLGVIGESGRMEETVIGDSVNITTRIEGLTKTYGSLVLISQNTVSNLKDPSKYLMRFVDWVKVKGKANPLPIYELINADEDNIIELKRQTLHIYHEAVSLFHLRQVDEAILFLEECIKINPKDKAAKVYYKRCQEIKLGKTDVADDILELKGWSGELSVVNKTIDNQHKELFRRIDILINSIKNRMGLKDTFELLDFLDEYVKIHFNDEQELMTQKNYPNFIYHKQLHDKFISVIEMLKQNMKQESKYPATQIMRVQVLVMDWLVNHIWTQDRRFGNFMRGN